MSKFRTGVQILSQVQLNKGRGLLRVRSLSAGRRSASASHAPAELLDTTTKSSGTEQPQTLQPKRSRSWFSVFRREEPPPPLKAVPQTKDDAPWLSFFKKKEVHQDALDQQSKEEKKRDSFRMEHQALVCRPDVVKILQQNLGSSEVAEQSGRENQTPPSTAVENRLLELQAQRLHPFQARISNITEYVSNVRHIKSKAIETKAQKFHMNVGYDKCAQPQYHGAHYPEIQISREANYKYKNLSRSFNQTSNLSEKAVSFSHPQELSEEITGIRLNKSETLSKYEENSGEYNIHQSAAHLKVPYQILAGPQACQPNNTDVKRFSDTGSAMQDTQPHMPENIDSYKPYKKYSYTELNVNNSRNTDDNIINKDSCEKPNGNSSCSTKGKDENYQGTETQSNDSAKAGSERDIGEEPTRSGQQAVKSTKSAGQIFHIEKRMYSVKLFERRSLTNENTREYSEMACESEYPLTAKLNETKDKGKDVVKNICQKYFVKPEIEPSYSEFLKAQLQKSKILKKMEANSCNESCLPTLSMFPTSELTASCNTDIKAGEGTGGWYMYRTTHDKTLQSEAANQVCSGKQTLLHGWENSEQSCNKSSSALSDLDISKKPPKPTPLYVHGDFLKTSQKQALTSSLQDSVFSENMKRTRKTKEETIMTVPGTEWVPLFEDEGRISNGKTNSSNSSETFSQFQMSNCEKLEDINTASSLKLPSCKPEPSCNTKKNPQLSTVTLKKPPPISVCETNKQLAAKFCSSKPTPSCFKENTPHLSKVIGDSLLVAQKITSDRAMDKQLNQLFKSDKKAKEKGLSNTNNFLTLENKGKKSNSQNNSTDISSGTSKQILSSSENDIPCLSKFSEVLKDTEETGSLGAIRRDFISLKEQQVDKDNNEQYSIELKTSYYVTEEVPASIGEMNLLPDPLGNKEEPYVVDEVEKRNEWMSDSSIKNLTVHPAQNSYIVKEPQIQAFKRCIPIKVISGDMSKDLSGRLRKHFFTSKMAYSTLSCIKTQTVNNYNSPKQYNPNLKVGHGSMCYSVRYQSKKGGGKKDSEDKKCKKVPFGHVSSKVEGECVKVVAPGCNRPKSIVCEKDPNLLKPCTRLPPPWPSYSECLKEETPPPRYTECKPFPGKTCEVKEKKSSYDGCNPPTKRKRSLCPDNRPEANRPPDKSSVNPPCEGPKPDDCNRKCAGTPSPPVRCYSSLCHMMGINQGYPHFETCLYSNIKANNVAACQERVYSQSSDSDKGKKGKDKCAKIPFGEVPPQTNVAECPKLVAPGCNRPKQTICEKDPSLLKPCTRLPPPWPSYSECLKEETPPPRYTECKPFPEKTCEVKEKKSSYDGCNPPGKRKRSLCPDNRPEANRPPDKSSVNPPCEGPKPDDCNRKCAGTPSSPVRCYSSLCCLMGIKQENTDLLSRLYTDLKINNGTVSTAVQCKPYEYSLSSDSGNSKKEKENCKKMLFGEIKHTTSEGECIKLVAPGYNQPTQTSCETRKEVTKCTRVPPPWPAYSECLKDQSLSAKFAECNPKGPCTCDTEKKKYSYDGCNPPDTSQKSVCPPKRHSKTERNKEDVADKSSENPPFEGSKQEDCNKECAGSQSSPVQCYSSPCCLMGTERENSNFLSRLHNDLKMNNVTVSRAVQCQPREYSQSSYSGKIPCISIKKSGASDKEGQRRKEDDIKRKSPGSNKVGSSSVPVRCYSDSFLRNSVPCKMYTLSKNYSDVKNSQLSIVSSFPYQSDVPAKGHEIGKTGGTKCKKYSFTHELAMKSKNESFKFSAYASNNAETASYRSEPKLREITPLSSYSKEKDYSKGESHMEFGVRTKPTQTRKPHDNTAQKKMCQHNEADHCNEPEGLGKCGYKEKELEFYEKPPNPSIIGLSSAPVGNTLDKLLTTVFPKEKYLISRNYSNINFEHYFLSKPNKLYVGGKGGRERSSPTLCKIQTKESEISSRKPHAPEYCDNTKYKLFNYRSANGHFKEETECNEAGRNVYNNMYFTNTENPKREILHHGASARENRNSYEQESFPHKSFTSSLSSCSSPSYLVEQKHEEFYFPTHMYSDMKIIDSLQKSNMHGSQGTEDKIEGSRKNVHGKNTSQKSKRAVPSGDSRLKYIPSKNKTEGIKKCTHSEQMKEQLSNLASGRNSLKKELDCDIMKQNLREESPKLSNVNVQSLFEGHKMAGFLQLMESSNSMEHSGFSLTNYFSQSFYFPKHYFSTAPIISLVPPASLRSREALPRSPDYAKNKLLSQEVASLLFGTGPTALMNNVIKRHYSEDQKKDTSSKEKCEEIPQTGESRVSCNRVGGQPGGKCDVKRTVLAFIKECTRPQGTKDFKCEVKKKKPKKPVVKELPKKTSIIECKKPIVKTVKCPEKAPKEEVCEVIVKPRVVKPFIECPKPPPPRTIDTCAKPKIEKVVPTGRCRMVQVQPFIQCPKPPTGAIRKCVEGKKSKNISRICHEAKKSKSKLCYIPSPDEKECEVPSKTSSEHNSKSGSEAPKQSRSASTDSRARLCANYTGVSKRKKLGFVCKKATLSSCRPSQSLKWAKYSKVVPPPKAFLECGKSVVGRQRAYKCTLKVAPKYLKPNLPQLEHSRYRSKPASSATKCTKKQDNKGKQSQCPKVTDGPCGRNRSVSKKGSLSFMDCLKSMLSFFKAREGCPEPGQWKKKKSKRYKSTAVDDEESTVQSVIKDATRGKSKAELPAKELERLLADDSQCKRIQQPGCKPPVDVVCKPKPQKPVECKKVLAPKPSFSECEKDLFGKSKFSECNFASTKEAALKKSTQKNQLECEPEEKIEELKGCDSQMEPEPKPAKSWCPFMKSKKKEELEHASEACKMSEEGEHPETSHRTSEGDICEAQSVQTICQELEDTPVKQACAAAKQVSKAKKIPEVQELIEEELEEISKKGDTSSKVKEIPSKCRIECKPEALHLCDPPYKSQFKEVQPRAVPKKDCRKQTEVCETIATVKQQRGNKKSPKKDNRKLSQSMPKEEPKDCKAPYLSSDYILKRRISTSTLPAELDLVANKWQLNSFQKDNQSSSGLACCDKGSRVSSDSLGPYLDLSTYYSNSLKFHMPIELSREGSSEWKLVGGEFPVYVNKKTSGFENPSLHQILSYSAVASLVSNNRVIFKPLYEAGKMHKAEFHHGILSQFCKKKAAHSEVIHKKSIVGSGPEKAINVKVKSKLECNKIPFKCPCDEPRRVKVKSEERVIDFPKHPCKEIMDVPPLSSNTLECKLNKIKHVIQEDKKCHSIAQLDLKQNTLKEDSKEAEAEFPKHPCKAPEGESKDCQEDESKIKKMDDNKQCKSKNQEGTRKILQNLSTCIKMPFKCPEEDSKATETETRSNEMRACKAVMKDKEDEHRKSNSNDSNEDKSCRKVNNPSDEPRGIVAIEIVTDFPKHPCKAAVELCAQPCIEEDIKMKAMETSNSDCEKRKPEPEQQNKISDECKLKDTVENKEPKTSSTCKKIPFKCETDDANEVEKEKSEHSNSSCEIPDLSLSSSEDKGKVQQSSVCTDGTYKETNQRKETKTKLKPQIISACHEVPPELPKEDKRVAQTEMKTNMKSMLEFPCSTAEEVDKNTIKSDYEGDLKLKSLSIKKIIPTSCVNEDSSKIEKEIKIKYETSVELQEEHCTEGDKDRKKKTDDSCYPKPECNLQEPGSKKESKSDLRQPCNIDLKPLSEAVSKNDLKLSASNKDLKQSSESAIKKDLKQSAESACNKVLKQLAEAACNKVSLKYLVQNTKSSKIGKMKHETSIDAPESVQKQTETTDQVIQSHLMFSLHNGDKLKKIDSYGNKEQREHSRIDNPPKYADEEKMGKSIGEQHLSQKKAKAENPKKNVLSKCSQACKTEVEKNKCDSQPYRSQIREENVKSVPNKSGTKPKGKAKLSTCRKIETTVNSAKKGDSIKIDKSAQKVTSSSREKINAGKRKLSDCKANKEPSRTNSDVPSIKIGRDSSNEVSLKDKIYCSKKCPPSCKVDRVLKEEDKTKATCHTDERKSKCVMSSKADSCGKTYAPSRDGSIQKRLSKQKADKSVPLFRRKEGHEDFSITKSQANMTSRVNQSSMSRAPNKSIQARIPFCKHFYKPVSVDNRNEQKKEEKMSCLVLCPMSSKIRNEKDVRADKEKAVKLTPCFRSNQGNGESQTPKLQLSQHYNGKQMSGRSREQTQTEWREPKLSLRSSKESCRKKNN